MGKLTALKVKNLAEEGRYSDGDGLMLEVGPTGTKKWVLRIQSNGRRRDLGLGSASTVSLAEAREAASDTRRQVRAGLDPVAEKKRQRAKMPTFRGAARMVHEELKPSWKNEKHGAQWLATLEAHAFPEIGDVPVNEVTGPMVRDLLSKIWLMIPETARRVRQRIATVLDFAHSKGWRPDEFPTNAVSKGLPRQPKKDQHFAAMPWANVPEFIKTLRETPKAGEPVRLAIELTILTAARSGEVRGARWNEIDLNAKVWSVPAARMKMGKLHLVPLAERAVAILKRMAELRISEEPDALIWPGERSGKPLSDMTFSMPLRRMGVGFTVHGFRSSFRDWAAEATNFPREVAEAALAHALESRVEAAYRRSDLLEKRRKMMEAWANHCAGRTAKVMPMQKRAG
jgi:integrase